MYLCFFLLDSFIDWLLINFLGSATNWFSALSFRFKRSGESALLNNGELPAVLERPCELVGESNVLFGFTAKGEGLRTDDPLVEGVLANGETGITEVEDRRRGE